MRQITEAQLGMGDYSQTHARYTIRLPKDHAFEDLFNPRYWAQLQKQNRLRVTDLVRVIAHDGSFDCELTVLSMVPGAVNMGVYPKLPANAADFTKPRPIVVGPMDHLGKPVIRVEQAGTRFRVIGLDNQEISAHPTEPEAEGALAAYLAQVRMRAPTIEESEAHAAAQKELIEKRNAAIAEKRAQMEARRPARQPAA